MLSFPSEWCILLTEPFETTNAIKKTGIISLYLLFIAIALYGFILRNEITSSGCGLSLGDSHSLVSGFTNDLLPDMDINTT